MRIVVCVKEVLDPDAVNNYALAGNLKIGADGRTLEVAAIPSLINGYDEQALEAALRIRDQGVDCTIIVVTIGSDNKAMLRQCAALGADEVVSIDAGNEAVDGNVIANILAAYVRRDGADLILCGRQASDDDQGVVPLLLAEKLGMPAATLARAIEIDGQSLTVVRATADGDEVVQGSLPAVVTVSNELGTPRFPTAKAKMAARKMVPVELTAASLGLSAQQLEPSVVLLKQFVPHVQGNCEFFSGAPAEVARLLMEKIRAN